MRVASISSVAEEVAALIFEAALVTGDRDLIDNARMGLARAGVIAAIQARDNDRLFEWLLEAVSYQGISDANALAFMERNGRASAAMVRAGLANRHRCSKLDHFWSFEGCQFHKGSWTCSRPETMEACALPWLPLRNGRLNQTAYALFLFLRDVTSGDLVSWIDARLATLPSDVPVRFADLETALLMPLGGVFGVSNKVLAMALADLLIAGDARRPRWFNAGIRMIAVDTLVHNWMHRTGILDRLKSQHAYGTACYGPRACAAIIEDATGVLDARTFNPAYPTHFPRFWQNAIWQFCSASSLDLCNGNRIDDRTACAIADCALWNSGCQRIPLRAPSAAIADAAAVVPMPQRSRGMA